MKHTLVGAACASVLIMASGAPADAVPVTYAFTGHTTYTLGNTFSGLLGAPVNGSFTIDFDAATVISGNPATSIDWEYSVRGGSNVGLPLPTAMVFTQTFTVGGLTYTSGPPTSPILAASGVYGSAYGSLEAGTTFISSNYTTTTWRVMFDAKYPGDLNPYLSNGYLNLTAIGRASGAYNFYGLGGAPSGDIRFAFDSLTLQSALPPGGVPVLIPQAEPVPVPAAAFLFGSGLLGLVGVAKRKRIA